MAQKNTQNIRGVVTDKLSQATLVGASIEISSLQKGATTDSLGKYTLVHVCHFVSYFYALVIFIRVVGFADDVRCLYQSYYKYY